MAIPDLIRKYFAAYESKNRAVLEALLTDDFTFSSPLDDRINRAAYFKRCWPNSAKIEKFDLKLIMESKDEAFVQYDCKEISGGRFSNTELFKIRDGKIEGVEVYFGDLSESDDDSPISFQNLEAEKQIRQMVADWCEAINTKNADALIDGVSFDARIFDLVLPIQYSGAQAIKKRAEEWLSSFEGPVDYQVRDLKITAGNNVAFCHSLNGVRGTKLDGAQIEMWWRTTYCFKKERDQWRMVHEHSSVPFDMQSGMAALDLKP